ncbi:group 1 truncated hemoglobin [bacterium]|nr:group 1 truncated hemoglobin [bacterium]
MSQQASVRFIGESKAGPATTLYDRIGGDTMVDKAVDIFYKKVLTDERISSFFENIDITSHGIKQKKFLTMMFGGPNTYCGKDMHSAHAHMRLNEGHFNAMLDNLIEALRDLDIFEDDISEIVAVANCVKDDVLNR